MAGKRLSLATLAGPAVETVPGSSRPTLVHVAPDQVAPTPLNPRQDFNPAQLEELGQSMAGGQLQPCVGITRAAYLRLFPEHEALLPACRIVMAAGERRWKAAVHVGLPTLDVHVREDIAESRVRFLTAVLTENVERSNFNYIEEARGLQQMLEMTDGNQTQAAEKLKKSKQWFSQRIGLLRLSEEMQALVVSGELKAFREMRMYSALPAEEQLPAWRADRDAQKQRKADPKPAAPQGDAYTAVYTGRASAGPGSETTAQAGDAPPAAPAPTLEPYTAVYAEPADGRVLEKPELSGDSVPEPRQEPAPAPAPAAPFAPEAPQGPRKMPWHDGVACAHLVIRKMESAERLRMIKHLLEYEKQEQEAHGEATA